MKRGEKISNTLSKISKKTIEDISSLDLKGQEILKGVVCLGQEERQAIFDFFMLSDQEREIVKELDMLRTKAQEYEKLIISTWTFGVKIEQIEVKTSTGKAILYHDGKLKLELDNFRNHTMECDYLQIFIMLRSNCLAQHGYTIFDQIHLEFFKIFDDFLKITEREAKKDKN